MTPTQFKIQLPFGFDSLAIKPGSTSVSLRSHGARALVVVRLDRAILFSQAVTKNLKKNAFHRSLVVQTLRNISKTINESSPQRTRVGYMPIFLKYVRRRNGKATHEWLQKVTNGVIIKLRKFRTIMSRLLFTNHKRTTSTGTAKSMNLSAVKYIANRNTKTVQQRASEREQQSRKC